ncbi:uroporphyrinogen decarboxylase [Candidatus Sumerlaeota bacterium]|nr:uroporphyrinogen decarboxylase [Candidatus Sumerlaeota bacterium]
MVTRPMQPAALEKLSLTPRGRMVRALRSEPVDRVPVWLMRQAGRYLPEYQAVRKQYDFLSLCKTPEAAADVSIQPVEIIGSDAVIIFNDILIPLEAAGAKVEFDDTGPRITNPLRAADDLAVLKSRELQPDEPVAGTIHEVRRRLGVDFPILGFVGAPWTLASYWIEGVVTRNFENILKMRWADPELLEQILERVTDVAIRYLRIQIEAGADAVQIFDTWGSMLRQSDYERFSGKWIRRIIAAVRDLDVPVIVYLNGCAPYLETLDSLGADCVSMDWRTDLATARAAIRPEISLQGNLDPLVLYTSPRVIEGAVRELFDKFPPQAGHIFNLGHGVLPKTPVENAKALIGAVKKYGAH